MSQTLYDFIVIISDLFYSMDFTILTHSVLRYKLSAIYRMSISVLILVIGYSVSPSQYLYRYPRTSTDNVCILPNVFSIHFLLKEYVFIYRFQFLCFSISVCKCNRVFFNIYMGKLIFSGSMSFSYHSCFKKTLNHFFLRSHIARHKFSYIAEYH